MKIRNSPTPHTIGGRHRARRGPRSVLLLALATLLAVSGLTAIAPSDSAFADGQVGTWVGGNGLYALSNGATNGLIEVACIDAGRAAPSNAVNTATSAITAPKMAYLFFKYTPGADNTTRAALGHLGHVSAELPHDHKNTPNTPSAAVQVRINELVDEANKYAGPYTISASSTTNPTATSGTVKKTFTVKSAAGFGVPGVTVSFVRNGSATAMSPASGSTNVNGQVAVTYSLANEATGGITANATGLASTSVIVYSAPTNGSGYQRVIGKAGATNTTASATATRPAVPNGNLRVNKVSNSASAPFLAGAIIDVRRGSATGPIVKTVTTLGTSAGILVSLPPGVYVGVERQAPENYLKDAPNVTVTVTSGTTKSMILENSPKGKFSLVKTDSASGERLGGVAFHAETGNGTTVISFVTSANGSYTSPYLQLAVGTKLRIVEDTPKPGYQSAPDQIVTLTRDGTGTGRADFENDKIVIPRGRVSVVKTDLETGAALAGATFKVTALGITLVTGTTNSSGVWTSPLLTTKKIGERVTIVETSAPAGYELDPTPHVVTITAAGTGTARVAMTNAEIVDTAGIQIIKTDEATGARVGGATFQVEVQKAGTGPWAPVSGGATAGIFAAGFYTSDIDPGLLGRIAIQGELSTPILEVGDRVRATEVAAAPGYLLPIDPADRVTTATVGDGADLEITAVNTPKRSVEVTKVSSRGEVLAGAALVACYRVGDRDLAAGEAAAFAPCVAPAGSAVTDQDDNPIDLSEWYAIATLAATDANGVTTSGASDWVRPGDDVLVAETAAPTGYSLSAKAAVTTVTPSGWSPECANVVDPLAAETFSGTVITCRFVNEPKTTVKIVKSVVDANGDPAVDVLPAGAVYRITDENGDVVMAATPPTGVDGSITFELEYLVEGQVLTFTEIDSPIHAAIDPTPFTGIVTVTEGGLLSVEVAQVDPLLLIGTQALDTETEGKIITPGGQITDTVSYSGLVPGKAYRIEGTLQGVNADGTVTDTGIAASTDFVAPAVDGTVDVVFTLPTDIEPGVYVVFEQLLVAGEVIARHEVPESEEQTVFLPGIGTTAIGSDGDKFVGPGSVITDTIAYEGLQPGLVHTASGELMTLIDGVATGTGIVGETVFTPTTPAGTVEVEFVLPADFVPGKTLVVFEDLVVAGEVIAVHHDATDEDQTVYAPQIGTEASDQADEDKYLIPGGTVVDSVSYTGLHVGQEYTVTGELMEIQDGVVIHTGIFGTATFTAENSTGSVEVEFEIPVNFVTGRVLVAFETLSYEGRQIAIHADAEDEDQTVYIPSVGTSAADQSDGDKYVAPGSTVVDTVVYAGLVPGVETVATGELMIVVDGEPTPTGIVGSTTFTPVASSGTVEVNFVLPLDFETGHTLVVFEDLTVEGTVVASHRDAKSVEQTVYAPNVGTTALDQLDGDKSILPGGSVADTVAYAGLVPGVEYSVSGEIMAKAVDGTVSGTGILGAATFTPIAATGSVAVVFVLPADIAAGDYVVFEDLTVGGTVIASHRVSESPEQSFLVPRPVDACCNTTTPPAPPGTTPPPVPPSPNLPATGVSSATATLAIVGLGLVLLGGLALALSRHRRRSAH